VGENVKSPKLVGSIERGGGGGYVQKPLNKAAGRMDPRPEDSATPSGVAQDCRISLFSEISPTAPRPRITFAAQYHTTG